LEIFAWRNYLYVKITSRKQIGAKTPSSSAKCYRETSNVVDFWKSDSPFSPQCLYIQEIKLGAQNAIIIVFR